MCQGFSHFAGFCIFASYRFGQISHQQHGLSLVVHLGSKILKLLKLKQIHLKYRVGSAFRFETPKMLNLTPFCLKYKLCSAFWLETS